MNTFSLLSFCTLVFLSAKICKKSLQHLFSLFSPPFLYWNYLNNVSNNGKIPPTMNSFTWIFSFYSNWTEIFLNILDVLFASPRPINLSNYQWWTTDRFTLLERVNAREWVTRLNSHFLSWLLVAFVSTRRMIVELQFSRTKHIPTVFPIDWKYSWN